MAETKYGKYFIEYDSSRWPMERRPVMSRMEDMNSTAHQTTKQNKAWAEEYKLAAPILDDRSGKTGKAYGAKTTPHMFIVDKKGYIAYEGALDNSPLGNKTEGVVNYVDQALAELTADKAVSTKKTAPYGCSVKYAK